MNIFRIILLLGLIICAAATAVFKRPLQAIIMYLAYSVIMSVVWLLMEAPDLAITEAAVGAGVTGFLFFLTLRALNLIDAEEHHSKKGKDGDVNDK